MLRSVATLALCLAALSGAGHASAFGLADPEGRTVVGQPLDLRFAVVATAGEALQARCAQVQVRLGERLLPAHQVRVRVAGEGEGAQRLRVTTTVPVAEPVVNLRVQLGCPASLTRELVLLADPPAAGAGLRPRPVSEVAPLQRPGGVTVPPAAATGTPLPDGPAATEPTERAPDGPPPSPADAARLQALEATVQALRAQTGRTEEALADMQRRLHEAQARREERSLLNALIGLCVLLGLGLLATWLRRREGRRPAATAPLPPAAPVWSASTHEPTAMAAPPRPPRPQPAPTALEPMPRPTPEREPEGEPENEPPSTPLVEVLSPRPLAQSPSAPPAEPGVSVSADELLDLEQQADFFVVLGQDDAAIDLLMAHVRGTGGASPVPYLKLLKIYRRRGERDTYERIRERFNSRFNAYAPGWDQELGQGVGLEGYADVLERLQAAWPRPTEAMALLDSAILRRDASPTFDVPAYRELLFLYAVASDLAQREVGVDGVDLLLPLDEEAPSWVDNVAPSEAAPWRAPGATGLDFDLSGDAAADADGAPPPFKPGRRPDA